MNMAYKHVRRFSEDFEPSYNEIWVIVRKWIQMKNYETCIFIRNQPNIWCTCFASGCWLPSYLFPNPIKTFSISSTSLFCRALPSATFTSKRTELFRLSVPCLPRYHHNQQILTLFFRKRGGPAQKVSVITIDIYKILTRSRRGESALKLSIII